MPRQAVKGSRWQPDKNQRSVVTVGSAVRLLQEKTQSLRYPGNLLGPPKPRRDPPRPSPLRQE
jgi:hypothetical protein